VKLDDLIEQVMEILKQHNYTEKRRSTLLAPEDSALCATSSPLMEKGCCLFLIATNEP